ncbi:hypothetical protein EGH31_0125 [Haemophilus haemolyticus]|uniref:Uncharacterized protein n=1 Tax=Haemophilus haemolyticus TaxID=726 RepID=A0AAQ1YPA8_HAEHA|nr:hypothetical protein EGH31_0125 [Haemophilus haemolyticus]
MIAVNMREFAILTRLLPALNNSLDFVLNTKKLAVFYRRLLMTKNFFTKSFQY